VLASTRNTAIARWPRLVVAQTVLASATGCPTEEPPEPKEPVTVTRFYEWEHLTDPTRDAFAAMRPAGTPCDPTGVGIEQFGLSYEVKTGLCDYATITQPSLVDLEVGDVLGIRGWHDVLEAEYDTQGFIGLAIDGQMVWHTTVPIPSDYDTIEGDLTIDEDHPAGTELQVHIHNHGINSWNVVDFRTVVETPEPG
jgi:hypothetical protein